MGVAHPNDWRPLKVRQTGRPIRSPRPRRLDGHLNNVWLYYDHHV